MKIGAFVQELRMDMHNNKYTYANELYNRFRRESVKNEKQQIARNYDSVEQT